MSGENTPASNDTSDRTGKVPKEKVVPPSKDITASTSDGHDDGACEGP